jgi:hypothetical protein
MHDYVQNYLHTLSLSTLFGLLIVVLVLWVVALRLINSKARKRLRK